MKAALSIFLAALLIILPVEQVLAQAVQQQAVSVQRGAQDPAARLFHVPPLTENSARLLRTSSDRTLLDTDFAEPVLMQNAPGWWGDLDGGAKAVVLVVGAIVVAGAAVGGAVAAGENNNPESFKSKHNVFYGIGLGALVAVPVVALFALIAYGCGKSGACQ